MMTKRSPAKLQTSWLALSVSYGCAENNFTSVNPLCGKFLVTGLQ